MSPTLPNKHIDARDLWPLKEGRSILENISDKVPKITQAETESWLLSIEQQWMLFSSKNELCDNYNIARQKLLEVVEIQKNLTPYISGQRCLAIAETGENEQWRLWQIIKIEKSLSSLLEAKLAESDAKKIAAILFVIADKFLTVWQQFSSLEIHLPLTLENVKLQDNKILFTGFLPTENSKEKLDMESYLKQAFTKKIDKISNNSAIDNSQILQYLAAYASDSEQHKRLLTVLSSLFKQ